MADEENKLRVLELIKSKQDVLFNSNHSRVANANAWDCVLAEAMSLGLTTRAYPWYYARDCLFGIWKCNTLSKGNNGKNNGQPLDRVDEAILDILGNAAPVELRLKSRNNLQVPVVNTTDNTNNEEHSTPILGGAIKPSIDTNNFESLRSEMIESELYYNKLKILKLEMEMQLPSSKFTSEFHNNENGLIMMNYDENGEFINEINNNGNDDFIMDKNNEFNNGDNGENKENEFNNNINDELNNDEYYDLNNNENGVLTNDEYDEFNNIQNGAVIDDEYYETNNREKGVLIDDIYHEFINSRNGVYIDDEYYEFNYNANGEVISIEGSSASEEL